VEVTEGKHFWEVELLSEIGGVEVGSSVLIAIYFDYLSWITYMYWR
jgi:hypothetical protein